MIKAALVIIAVWACVWAVRAYAGSRKITAESVDREVARANFADWSGQTSPPDAAETRRRDGEIHKIAGLVNRLDFQEREKSRETRSGETFFRKLAPDEKGRFIDLTIVESMGRFMESLDAMKPDQRRKFVEQGLKDIQAGRTGADLARADALGTDLLDKISQQGMKAYFEKSSADTKLDLAPLMNAINEQMQGLRNNEFGPRQ